jgi:hypothetical protein
LAGGARIRGAQPACLACGDAERCGFVLRTVLTLAAPHSARSLTLSHPNVLQAYKMCAVKVLTGADGEARGEAPANGTSPRLAGSGEFGSGGRLGSSGGRVVPHLTDPGCMVEVMPSDAVLEPG